MGTRTLPAYKSRITTFDYQGNPSSKGRILWRYIFSVLPGVKKLLQQWTLLAGCCPEPELRVQALDSIKYKTFHCQGGAVFAIAEKRSNLALLRLIVAYQTLCDYLDNLCDRAGQTDGRAFGRLHQSLLDALDPGRPVSDYYKYFPLHNDGGYINQLVDECRKNLMMLPSYHLVQQDIMRLVDWYCQLQVKKHLDWNIREKELGEWIEGLLPGFPGLLWNELAAATGSTLAVFALLKLACQAQLDKKLVNKTFNAYFPWICALHILLDYFIDQQEDRVGMDLNFTFYYVDEVQMMDRLKICVREARRSAAYLPGSLFDLTVVEGLLAMYLSDGKIVQQGLQVMARDLINECGGQSRAVLRLCQVVRIFL